MRPIVIFLALAGIGIISWLIIDRPVKHAETPKRQALAVSKHSDSFNTAISRLLSVYSLMQDSFVKWDSVSVKEKAIDMGVQLNDFKLDELKNDSTIYLTAETFLDNVKGDLQTIENETRIRPQREAFNSLTGNLYQFLNTVKFDREKLYLQECPMAFDDTKPGQWLSENEEIRNPYLGLHHPTYGRGMLKCGETKETMNHTGEE